MLNIDGFLSPKDTILHGLLLQHQEERVTWCHSSLPIAVAFWLSSSVPISFSYVFGFPSPIFFYFLFFILFWLSFFVSFSCFLFLFSSFCFSSPSPRSGLESPRATRAMRDCWRPEAAFFVCQSLWDKTGRRVSGDS